MTFTAPQSYLPKTHTAASIKKRNFSGHETLLNHFLHVGKNVRLTTLSGKTVSGYVRAFDAYTISLEMEDGHTEVFFKHALESFCSFDME